MFEWINFLLLTVVFMGQIGGITLLFFNKTWAILFFTVYVISSIILITIFIIERKKEKKEEIDYENCNY